MLSVSYLIGRGFIKTFTYFPYLMANLFLWVVTIWIPYLNVGTTAGLFGIVAKMGRGEPVGFLEIFNPVYRKRFGNIYLIVLFTIGSVLIGFSFLLLGFVLAISWALSVVFIADEGMPREKAAARSARLTNGKKATISIGMIILMIIHILVIAGFTGYDLIFFGPLIFFICLPAYILYFFCGILSGFAVVYEALAK